MKTEAAKGSLSGNRTLYALHARYFNVQAREAVESNDAVRFLAVVVAAKPHYECESTA